MPRSKRYQVVNLNKTKKKVGKQVKEALIDKVKSYMETFNNVVVFNFQNMPTNSLKALKEELSDCKFCLGKKKVMRVAFGTEDKELYTNSHLINNYISGQVGLLFTNRKREEIEKFMSEYRVQEFANPGTVAIADVQLLEGNHVFKGFSTSNVDYISKLGLDVEVTDAKIKLARPFFAAEKGKPLTVEQSKILKFLGIKLSSFSVTPKAFYSKDGGIFAYE